MKWWHLVIATLVEKVPEIIRAIKGSKDESNSKRKENDHGDQPERGGGRPPEEREHRPDEGEQG